MRLVCRKKFLPGGGGIFFGNLNNLGKFPDRWDVEKCLASIENGRGAFPDYFFRFIPSTPGAELRPAREACFTSGVMGSVSEGGAIFCVERGFGNSVNTSCLKFSLNLGLFGNEKVF